jgi:hypothetical protein
MTSSSPSSGRRIWAWLGARFLSLAIAAVPCLFPVGPSGRNEMPMLQAVSAEPAPPITRVASEAVPALQPEPIASVVETGPPEQAAPDASATETGLIASHGVPSAAPSPDPEMDEVNQYLWSVYQRTATKHDGTGDFTWKDVAAAARLGLSLGDYVIGGMDRDFRELLYRAGLAMDAAGLRWSILSAFRDDYRQMLASGYKAHTGDSLHGGSATVGGYGHGCAIDVVDADAKSRLVWSWIAANGVAFALERPLAGFDPAHVQPRGPWHAVAAALRTDRLAKAEPDADTATGAAPAVEPAADPSATAPTEADMMCIGLHHHRNFDSPQAMAGPELATAKTTPAPAPGKKGGEKPKAGSRIAARDSKSAGKSEVQHSKSGAHPVARPAAHTVPHTTGTT